MATLGTALIDLIIRDHHYTFDQFDQLLFMGRWASSRLRAATWIAPIYTKTMKYIPWNWLPQPKSKVKIFLCLCHTSVTVHLWGTQTYIAHMKQTALTFSLRRNHSDKTLCNCSQVQVKWMYQGQVPSKKRMQGFVHLNISAQTYFVSFGCAPSFSMTAAQSFTHFQAKLILVHPDMYVEHSVCNI